MDAAGDNMIRTQISLDAHDYKLLKREAASQGISIAEYVRQAVREKLLLRPGKLLADSLANVFRDGNALRCGFALQELVIVSVQADLRADHVITCCIHDNTHPIPSSSIRSSGVPQTRQMSAWQSPHTSGSATGRAQAGQ